MPLPDSAQPHRLIRRVLRAFLSVPWHEPSGRVASTCNKRAGRARRPRGVLRDQVIAGDESRARDWWVPRDASLSQVTAKKSAGHGGIVTGCSTCVMKEAQCLANASVGSQPAGIMPLGETGLAPIVAALTYQFAPPHVSRVLRHQDGRTGGDWPGQPVASLGLVSMNP